MKTLAFFNNKGGVGKTSLVYHLAWMFAERGLPVLAVDLDPQANLTAMFLEEERLEELWPDADEHPSTVYGAVQPILRGLGDIAPPPSNASFPISDCCRATSACPVSRTNSPTPGRAAITRTKRPSAP